MRKYDLILLDFDGTLGNSFHWFGSALHRAARRFKFKEIENHEIDHLRGLEAREIISYLNIAWWKMPFVSSYLRNLMKKEIHLIKPFMGVENTLLQLHREGYTLVLVTSNSFINVSSVLAPNTLSLIDSYECGVSLFGKKSRFKKILSRYDFAPERVLSIGDEVRDIEAAKGLGIHSAAVAWGYAKEEALRKKNPNFIFTDCEQLLTNLTENGSFQEDD
jgi:phosphoglycolate phosphatase